MTINELFNYVPQTEMVWILSRESPNISLKDTTTDVFPEGTYLVIKVPDFMDKKGMFQVPFPNRATRD